jgi:hypothetical protein
MTTTSIQRAHKTGPGGVERRKRRLIRPDLQWTMIGSFLGLACLALLLQFVLVGWLLTRLATRMPSGGDYLVDAIPSMLGWTLLLSFGLLVPAVAVVGVWVTFGIAGPIHRFETYLESVARGEDVGPCRLRSGDKLQSLCRVINEALEAARSSGAKSSPDVERPPLRSVG